jgi:hypothetical protein
LSRRQSKHLIHESTDHYSRIPLGLTAIVVLVHEIYQREKVDDVMQWRDAVKFPIPKISMVLAA